ncbi:MAG TPA: sulfotransferase domain-containing protein [Rhizomicrobium sp.]
MRFTPETIKHPIELPPATSSAPSVMAFSFHKGGSTLLFNMLRRLSRNVGFTFYSIDDKLFADNVSAMRRPTDIGDIFNPTGYCFGGFRRFPIYPIPLLDTARTVFLIRDPRDMITSLYFSLLKSHRLPAATEGEGAREEMLATRARLEQMDMDTFANERLPGYVKEFEGYAAQGFHWRPNVATYRYEDVIFRKREWIADICDWFGWSPPPKVVDKILGDVDVVPDAERPDEHIRQVSPGNYKKHLGEGTVEHINGVLGEYMRLYGYLDA